MVPERCGAPAGDLHFRCTDHAGGPDRAAGAFPVLHRCIFSDGISVYRGAVLRRKHRDDRAASDHDAESCSCVSRIDHGILGARSGPPGERHALVRLSGAALFQYFLCLPDPAGADGRVPEYPALLQAAGQSAFKERAGRQDPVSGVSDQDDHSGVLSADAQYGEAFQNDRGSAGTQRIPPFDPESGSEENEAGHAESDPGGPHFCMHFHCLGMRKLRRVGSAVDPRRRVETGISFFTGRMNKEA